MQRRMENLVKRKRKYLQPGCLLIGVAGLVASGCGLGYEASSQGSPRQAPIQPAQLDSTLTRNASEPCAVALAPQTAGDPIDRKISRLQEEARRTPDPAPVLERLGWLFVSKARTTHDPGYFKLAEQVAVCMGSRDEKTPSALLLRGHVLHNLHRFKEAESVARELLILRQAPFDYGLLGDALMEQGRLEQAAEAYQKMVDLKPGLHSYSRVAHLRWLKGDFAGAIPVMRMAARASSPRDAESVAWVYTRLALLELQAGDFKKALRASSVALGSQAGYAPALLVRSRVLLATERNDAAIDTLWVALAQNPIPEYQWLLADSLRLAGRGEQAAQIEDQLRQRGAQEDPRTLGAQKRATIALA